MAPRHPQFHPGEFRHHHVQDVDVKATRLLVLLHLLQQLPGVGKDREPPGRPVRPLQVLPQQRFRDGALLFVIIT